MVYFQNLIIFVTLMVIIIGTDKEEQEKLDAIIANQKTCSEPAAELNMKAEMSGDRLLMPVPSTRVTNISFDVWVMNTEPIQNQDAALSFGDRCQISDLQIVKVVGTSAHYLWLVYQPHANWQPTGKQCPDKTVFMLSEAQFKQYTELAIP
jgi:hypothetical protein